MLLLILLGQSVEGEGEKKSHKKVNFMLNTKLFESPSWMQNTCDKIVRVVE